MINYSIVMRSVNANLLEINQAKSRINQAKKEGKNPDQKDLELVKTEKQKSFIIDVASIYYHIRLMQELFYLFDAISFVRLHFMFPVWEIKRNCLHFPFLQTRIIVLRIPQSQ